MAFRPLVLAATLAAVGLLAAGCSSTSIPPATTTTTTQAPTTSAAGATPAEWAAEYGHGVALVIASASGLITAISEANATAIATSCSALIKNDRTYLAGNATPPPGDELKAKFDAAKNELYSAQRTCAGGVIATPDYQRASVAATSGLSLLNQILDAAGKE